MTAKARVSTSLPQVVPLGVLSIHLDGAPCRVKCEFCYLGQRSAGPVDGALRVPVAADGDPRELDLDLVCELLARLDYAEVAVAVSEPAGEARAPLRRIAEAARARGKPLSVTTTAQVLALEPWITDGVARVNLSVDPRKGAVDPRRIALSARAAKRRDAVEVVLIASLVTPAFAAWLVDEGGLAALLALDDVDKVALNGLKPPPPWCDRAFWLSACARLAPLLERHLDRRLFLDCYVAARILRLGGCPARPDLSPGNQFRACVYQPAPDFVFHGADDAIERLATFEAPALCPFPIV